MSREDPGDIKYNEIGGLQEQIRELREVRIFISDFNYNIIIKLTNIIFVFLTFL
jgi:hypothetical protein